MASIDSAWFIGSVVLPASTITVNGVDVTLPAGTYYLTDPSGPRSLVTQFAATIAPQAPGATAVLTGSGRVRMAATDVFTVVWGTSVALRQALGFGEVIAGSTAYVAVNKSPLWWSPGKPAMFMQSPLGTAGSKRHIVNQSVAAYSGRAQSTSFGHRVYQTFAFEKIDFERLQTTAGAPGEFDSWYTQVAVRSARFKVYSAVAEDTANTTAAFTYESVVGPYILPLGRSAEWNYKRSSGHQWTDFTCDLSIDANGCPEIA